MDVTIFFFIYYQIDGNTIDANTYSSYEINIMKHVVSSTMPRTYTNVMTDCKSVVYTAKMIINQLYNHINDAVY